MEHKIVTNRTTKPSCLIYKLNIDVNNPEKGIIELWSSIPLTKGDKIESNYQLSLKLKNKDNYYPFREFVIDEILKIRDFKGAWKENREQKNKQSYYTVLVSKEI
jgi:hypothetical protein